MASQYDATEFVDTETHQHKSPYAAATSLAGAMQRAPTRAEVDLKVTEAQQKLAELKRAQEELERERAALEELRPPGRVQTGRQEMVHHLTRGLGLLEEAEFTARRDAEQMAKTLTDFREALAKVESIQEETWNKESFSVELTRALTAIENARMEWNSARPVPGASGKMAEFLPKRRPGGQPRCWRNRTLPLSASWSGSWPLAGWCYGFGVLGP
jgi:hypothetical protein